MYPQEKRHECNTLSFLNDRPDRKRFSLSSPHPNLLSAAGLGLGQETEHGSCYKAQFLPKQGQNFQDGRGLDENARGPPHSLSQCWKDDISPLKWPELSTPIPFFPLTHPITNPRPTQLPTPAPGDGQGGQNQVCPRGRSRTEGPLSPTQGRSSFPSDKLRTYKQIKSQANLSDGRQSQSTC